jgi:NADH-quinone oxidoreductase E subunit
MGHISEKAEERLRDVVRRYPNSRSAVMPALYLAQEHFGYISEAAVQWVAERLDLAPVQVMEVATFYTMYYKKPVGKYHVQVCRTLSCAIRGSKNICEYLKERLGVEPHEITPDGQWSFEQVECLGSCGTAPMCQINDRFFENLTVEKLEEVLNQIEMLHPPLRLSAAEDTLGDGLDEYPRSEVL